MPTQTHTATRIYVVIAAATVAGAILLGCESRSDSGDSAAGPDGPPPESANALSPDRQADSTRPDAEGQVGDPGLHPDDDHVARFVGLRGPIPQDWQPTQPQSAMRAAEYIVQPDEAGEGGLSVIVFHFGEGVGGTIEANIDRWRGQFRPVDGRPPDAEVAQFQADGMPVTMVEISGDHQPMGRDAYNEDQLMLAGIVESPQGLVFIQLVGPAQSVEPHREHFLALLEGLERE